MKKKIALGAGAVLLAGSVFLLAHRPLNAPAEENSLAPAAKEAVAPGSPAPESAPAAPAAGPMSREEFTELLNEAVHAIPSQAELRRLPPEETHMTPRVLRLAGLELGRVAEALEANPQLAADGLRFYESCVRTETNPTSVRALCLSDYEKLAGVAHLPARDDIAPPKVRELANRLNGI